MTQDQGLFSVVLVYRQVSDKNHLWFSFWYYETIMFTAIWTKSFVWTDFTLSKDWKIMLSIVHCLSPWLYSHIQVIGWNDTLSMCYYKWELFGSDPVHFECQACRLTSYRNVVYITVQNNIPIINQPLSQTFKNLYSEAKLLWEFWNFMRKGVTFTTASPLCTLRSSCSILNIFVMLAAGLCLAVKWASFRE